MTKAMYEKISDYLFLLAVIALLVAYPVGMAGSALVIPVLMDIGGVLACFSVLTAVIAVCVGLLSF